MIEITLFYKQKWFPHFNHSIVKLDNIALHGYLSITKGNDDDEDDDDDDDYDVFIKEVGDCF